MSVAQLEAAEPRVCPVFKQGKQGGSLVHIPWNSAEHLLRHLTGWHNPRFCCPAWRSYCRHVSFFDSSSKVVCVFSFFFSKYFSIMSWCTTQRIIAMLYIFQDFQVNLLIDLIGKNAMSFYLNATRDPTPIELLGFFWVYSRFSTLVANWQLPGRRPKPRRNVRKWVDRSQSMENGG